MLKNLKSRSGSGRQRGTSEDPPRSRDVNQDQPSTPVEGNGSRLLSARAAANPILKHALRPSVSGSSVSRSQSQPPSLRVGGSAAGGAPGTNPAKTLRALLTASHVGTPNLEVDPDNYFDQQDSKKTLSTDQTLVSRVSMRITEAVARVFLSDTPGAPSLITSNAGTAALNGALPPRPLKAKEAGDIVSSELIRACRQMDSPSVRVLLRSSVLRGLSLFMTNLKQCVSAVSAHRSASKSINIPLNTKDVDSLDFALKYEIELLRSTLYMKNALVSVIKTPSTPSFVVEGLRPWVIQLDSTISYIIEPILQAYIAKVTTLSERLAYTESGDLPVAATPAAVESWIRDLSALLDASAKLVSKMDVAVDGQIWLFRIGVAATWRVIIHMSTLPLNEPEVSPLSITATSPGDAPLHKEKITLPDSVTAPPTLKRATTPVSHLWPPNHQAHSLVLQSLSTPHLSTQKFAAPPPDTRPGTPVSAPLVKARRAAAAVTGGHNSHTETPTVSPARSPQLKPTPWISLSQVICDLRLMERKLLSFAALAGYNPETVPKDVLLRSLCNDADICPYCKLNRRYGDDSSLDEAEQTPSQSRLDIAQSAMFEAIQGLSAMILLLGASSDPVVLLASLRAAAFEDEQDKLSSSLNERKPLTPGDFLSGTPDLSSLARSLDSEKVLSHVQHWPPAKPACATVAAALDVVPTIVLVNVMSRRVPSSARLQLINEYWSMPWLEFARQELPNFVEAEKYAQEYIDELAHRLKSLKLPPPWSDIMNEVLKIEPN